MRPMRLPLLWVNQILPSLATTIVVGPLVGGALGRERAGVVLRHRQPTNPVDDGVALAASVLACAATDENAHWTAHFAISVSTSSRRT
jgi:hypothetical protein